MLVYRGVFYGHVSFIPLQGIWDVALRKGPTTSVYPASGGPRRRGLVQCLHFGIVLPQILGELIRCDACFFFNGLKVETGNYSQQIQTPQPIEWIDEWLVIFEQVHSTILSCRKNSQHQTTIGCGVETMRPIAKNSFLSGFSGLGYLMMFLFFV